MQPLRSYRRLVNSVHHLCYLVDSLNKCKGFKLNIATGQLISQWHCLRFAQLTNRQLFDCLKLRTDVFVVEQQCAYPELDDKDCHPDTHHLFALATSTQNPPVTAYARLLPPGLSYPQASIGRVVVAAEYRGHALGKALIKRALEHCHKLWPQQPIKIGAQSHLQRFYGDFGFVPVSSLYMEDGIEHIAMQRPARPFTR